MLTWEDILRAQQRLDGIAHRTPVLRSSQFDALSGARVWFKAENLQRVGAFKFRGAYNKIRAELETKAYSTVVAYSSGNHAQAVALSAKLLGLKAVIVMPKDAPALKVEATRNYGADIHFYDRYTENREEIGKRICSEQNAMLVPPYDDYLVMAGQGTAAVELLQEVPDLDCLITPVSGGGLISGCAMAAKHLRAQIEIYGAEPETGNDTYLSLQKGERVRIDVPRTIADGLQVDSPGRLTFPIEQQLVSGILLISDQEMIRTVRFLLERMKIVVEPSGAAGAAAVLFHKTDFAEKKVGIILSGGNVDPARLKEWIG